MTKPIGWIFNIIARLNNNVLKIKKKIMYDVVILAKNKDLPFIRYSLSKTVLVPERYHIIIDDVESATVLLQNITSHPLNIVSSKRFPFTITQVLEKCKNSALAETYRNQLLYLYCFSVLEMTSENILILNVDLMLDDPALKLFDGTKHVYNYIHGCYLPNFLHMKKLLPTLERKLYVSAKSPYFMLNKPILEELMDEVVKHHENTKTFWEIYLDSIDTLSYYENASWQEIYLNYVASKYPATYVLEKVHTLPYPVVSENCQTVFSPLYKTLWSKVSLSSGEHKNDISINYEMYDFQLVPYLTYIKQLRNSISNEKVTIVDVGCGIFKSLFSYIPWKQNDNYIGIDCVESVILYNKKHHNNHTFEHLDATNQVLPDGDICLVRNMLGYLSHNYVHMILYQLQQKYKYVLITDIVPNNQTKTNINKTTNTYFNKTGFWLESPPFTMVFQTVLNLPVDKNNFIRTVLIMN